MVRTASGPILWFMKLIGFEGWTSFWGVVYFVPGKQTPALLRHELKHLEQIERGGRIMFSIKYLYWLARYGYLQNPYEIEARNAQHE